MAKESRHPIEQQDILWAEYFLDEMSVRRNGGNPHAGATYPTFFNGIGIFDGITAEIDYPRHLFHLSRPERAFSIRTRVYLTDTDASVFLQLYDNAFNFKEFRFMIAGIWPVVGNADKFVLELWDTVGTAGAIMVGRSYNTALTTIALNKWTEFVATYDGRGGANAQDGICLYMDGVRVDDTDIIYDIHGSDYVNMKYSSDLIYQVGRNVEGKMEFIEVWNRVLTPEEISNMFGS